MSIQTHNFYDLPLHQLQLLLGGLGKESYRSKQLFQWVYQRGITNFGEMTDLSKNFRSELPQLLEFSELKKVKSWLSQDGTQKFLFDVGNGRTVESVLIPSEGRLTLCISSEVGCNMGCTFCYTGTQKLKQRLTAGQIVGQFLGVTRDLPEGQRISNIVFMGMGEPLDNCAAVFSAIDILKQDIGCHLSRRKITVSTSGIVPKIPLVEQAGVRLAVSLNAVTDELRSKIMPINKRWPLAELLAACKEHCRLSRDKITFEYVLLKGVTDSLDDARKLVKLLADVPSKINIIPFNEHPGAPFERPAMEQVRRFQDELIRRGAHVLLRKTMGRDIYAACGQLTTA